MSATTGTPAAEARDPRRPWAPGPFTRLARTHALSVAGDTAFTVAMAGTVFFSVNDLDEARSRVALTLIFTIAPFAVAAPLIGPALDGMRGGRRGMIIAINAARIVVALLLSRHYDSWLLYLEGLLMLVLSKGYLIARGALVPTVVRSDEELVKANAKLTLLSGITGAVMVVPAGLLLQIGPSWSLGLATLLFVGATVMAFQLPRTTVAAEPIDAAEKEELRSIGILLAASSMGLVRGIVGFLAFLVAFYAKDQDLPVLLGVAAVTAQGGFVLASLTAPRLREAISEERILMSALIAIVAVALPMGALVATDDGTVPVVFASAMVSLVVGFASNVGKQAFDSIVQRDAPDANRGRSFARFETRFQLVWVVGALLPVALGIPMAAAFVFIAAVAAFAATSYGVGRRRAARGLDPRVIRVDRDAVLARVRPGRAAAGTTGARSRVTDVEDTDALEARRRRTLGDQSRGGATRRQRRRARGGAGSPTSVLDPAATSSGEHDPNEDATLLMQLVEPGPAGGLFDGRIVEEPRSKVDPERPFDTGKPLIEARPRWRNDPPEPPEDDLPETRDEPSGAAGDPTVVAPLRGSGGASPAGEGHPVGGAEDPVEPVAEPDPHEGGRLFDASALGPDASGPGASDPDAFDPDVPGREADSDDTATVVSEPEPTDVYEPDGDPRT